jgi:hypothetical protein
MWMSQHDLENSEQNEHLVLWIAVLGVVVGAYLAIFV